MEVCRVDASLGLNCLSLNTCSRFKCCAVEVPFRQKMATEGRWLPVHVLSVQGQQQELVLKANVFPDEGVWWDLYEPLHYLIQNKALKIGRVLGKDMHELVSALGGLDGPH
eukprot:5531319-Amphidinium_carterae.1